MIFQRKNTRDEGKATEKVDFKSFNEKTKLRRVVVMLSKWIERHQGLGLERQKTRPGNQRATTETKTKEC